MEERKVCVTSNSVEDEARRLPREPTSSWIVGLFISAAALGLGVLIWQIGALPQRVPTQFEFGGPPTSWTSKTSALVTFIVTAIGLTLPALLISPLILRAPGAINAPNQHWWVARPLRLRRFERLVREDLLLLASAALAFLAIAQAGITVAATSPEGEIPLALMAAMLAPAAALIVVIARMCGAGRRYDKQPELS